MRLFARRRAVPTPADLHADSLRRVEAAVAPALNAPVPRLLATATHTGPLPIVPIRGSYTVTYRLRGHDPEPITTSDVDAIELAAEIRVDVMRVLDRSDVEVVVDLGKRCGLVRAGGLTVGTFDLARVGGAL